MPRAPAEPRINQAPASPDGQPPAARNDHRHMRPPPLMTTNGVPGIPIPAVSDNWLISFELSQMAKEHTDIKFPQDLLTTDPFQDSPHFLVWYFRQHEKDYWKIGQAHNWATMQKYKEGILGFHKKYASSQGFTLESLFEVSNTSWKRHSPMERVFYCSWRV